MFNNVKNLWYRYQACKFAAIAIAPRLAEIETPCPILWSATVFFEEYLRYGAKETQADFGPSEPVELKSVKGE